MNARRYFGTDGIRGRVGEWPITAEFMLKLGRAVGAALPSPHGKATVLIGKDTRISGYMFEAALESGLVAAGADVRLLGPMPTPAVAWLTRSLRADVGIVISASHNPHQDNGIKFFSGRGEKLPDAVEAQIEEELRQPFATVGSEAIGKVLRIEDGEARYGEFCKSTVPAGLDLGGLSIVLDCAHGATYKIAPAVFAELGAKVRAIGVRPDGLNINHRVGSTHPEALARDVLATRADLGIAFDGDGDRVILVDHTGEVVDGDGILHVLASDWHASGRLRGPVVGTLMSNFGLEQAIGALGVPFLRAKVGDRYVLELLKEHGGVLGGETSGHILTLDRATTGDGIVSALQVLEVLQRRGLRLRDAVAGLGRVAQLTRNVRTADGARIVAEPAVEAVLARVRDELADRGRVVLRPSGTEPLVRITVEAGDAALVARLADELEAAVVAAATRPAG